MDINTAQQTVHTPAFVAQAWIAFGIGFGGTGLGIYNLPIDGWPRAFLTLGLAFTVSSAFTLAKTIRDIHEASQLVKRVDHARTEKLLNENPPSLV
ncbi:MAG: hypothetical protein GY929_17205 [Actinomycetia bacterium]|nr:hypothetical protein [Actinomycetes bacterium]MCP3913061.1 hypothetical protein [Actinomycetes bacterium]MCP4087341.1 hypothetical protein [Actinomycetes bacterium]MCP5028015.1 hypothetical protein [Actinomycetes bacterium]